MVQGGEQLRLPLEAGAPLGILRESGGEHLDRHVPPQAGVAGAVHLAHAPRPELAGDLVGAEALAGHPAESSSGPRNFFPLWTLIKGIGFRAAPPHREEPCPTSSSPSCRSTRRPCKGFVGPCRGSSRRPTPGCPASPRTRSAAVLSDRVPAPAHTRRRRHGVVQHRSR